MDASADSALYGAGSVLVSMNMGLHTARQALTCRSAVDTWPDGCGVVRGPALFGHAPSCLVCDT